MGTFIFVVLFIVVIFMIWGRYHRLERNHRRECVEYDDELQDIMREAKKND